MINEPARTSWLFRGTMSTPVYLWRIPDALIGKLEGLKPPRVALVSLHLGAFSFPEGETMFPVSNHIATMSSVELVEIINSMREDGAAELLHKNFLAKIENHPGIQSPKFLGDYKDSRGRMQKCYHLPKREAELMVMSESLEVQTKVYDRLAFRAFWPLACMTTPMQALCAISAAWGVKSTNPATRPLLKDTHERPSN